ncbi:helix-turn-helix domain-containing protein [Sorangium sp. So ce1078]|uniref:helix-turn-helix domain-containing protein n=1 Tax=Sorangium sp. So ce1078 TaxID=3133329 RepID=UPI003F601E8B
MPLHLFLAHADTHEPVLADGLPKDAVHAPPRPATPPRKPTHLAERSGLPDALPAQRWGVVVPRGDAGKRLLDRIAPLMDKRREDQRAEVQIYEVDPGMDPEAANRWIGEEYRDQVGRQLADLPRYLLILGGPDLVSWDFQQMLGGEAFVGRLAFTDERGEIDEQGYEAYVDKLLRWEKRGEGDLVEGARAILYTARDGTGAIAEGHERLVTPLRSAAEALRRKGRFPAAELVEIGGGEGRFSDDDLLDHAHDLLARAERAEAGLLFSMSHGLGLPASGRWASPEEQRRMQGAMRISRSNDRIAAKDLRGRRFLPGGLWLFFACFGAGTPARSAYLPWLEQLAALGLHDSPAQSVLSALPRDGERPFVAALPQQALANPDGPLGVIGHVDLSWTWSFQDEVATMGGAAPRPRHERFQEALRSAVNGHRFGVAHHEIASFFGELNRNLTAMYEKDAASSSGGGGDGGGDGARRARRADLWMQRQDLAAYVLLGDPAARLPVARVPPGVAVRGAAREGVAPEVGAAQRDPREMEAAVLEYLRGGEAESVAARHGATREELEGWVETYQAWGRRGLATRG